MENEMAVQSAPTPEQTDAPETVQQPEQTPVQTPEEKHYTKEQVINMMKRRIARSHNAVCKRYGVKDFGELDKRIELASKYDELNSQFAPIQARNLELTRENAFLRNNVNPDKYNDIVAYFKGNDLEFTEEALLQALGTHPEWLKPSTTPAPSTTMKSFGVEKQPIRQETEEEKFNRIYGFTK